MKDSEARIFPNPLFILFKHPKMTNYINSIKSCRSWKSLRIKIYSPVIKIYNTPKCYEWLMQCRAVIWLCVVNYCPVKCKLDAKRLIRTNLSVIIIKNSITIVLRRDNLFREDRVLFWIWPWFSCVKRQFLKHHHQSFICQLSHNVYTRKNLA